MSPASRRGFFSCGIDRSSLLVAWVVAHRRHQFLHFRQIADRVLHEIAPLHLRSVRCFLGQDFPFRLPRHRGIGGFDASDAELARTAQPVRQRHNGYKSRIQRRSFHVVMAENHFDQIVGKMPVTCQDFATLSVSETEGLVFGRSKKLACLHRFFQRGLFLLRKQDHIHDVAQIMQQPVGVPRPRSGEFARRRH